MNIQRQQHSMHNLNIKPFAIWTQIKPINYGFRSVWTLSSSQIDLSWPKVRSKLTLPLRNIKLTPWYNSSTWFSCPSSKYWSEEQILKVLFCAGFRYCSKTDNNRIFESGSLYREFWTDYTSKYCGLDETKLSWLWFVFGSHGFDRDWPEGLGSNRINI